MSFIQKQLHFYKQLDQRFKRNSVCIFLCYFFILLSYPSIRSVAQSIFYDHYGVADYSYANFLAVIALSAIIALMNFAKKFITYKTLFSTLTLMSMTALVLSFLALSQGMAKAAFSLFIFKEAYIVLLLHLCLASANANFSLERIKYLYGPLGAIGSLGGIIGGQFTSFLSFDTSLVFGFGVVCILLAMFSFLSTRWQHDEQAKREKQSDFKVDKSPIASLKTVKRYVFLIAFIVMLSQWVIYLADLQFNMIFESSFESSRERTNFLGQVYSWVNILSLLVQVLFLPWLLVKFSSRKLFASVPAIYFLTLALSLTLGSVFLFSSTLAFIVFKGCDYSLFNTVKEVMYYPLSREQKFGAKFITDMFVYRAGKALIALLMAQGAVYSFFSDPWRLAMLQGAFISFWMFALIWLFREQRKMNFKIAEKL